MIPDERNLDKSEFSMFRSQFAGLTRLSNSLFSSQTKAPAFIIELNTADTFDLQRLRGIGPSFARRITGYRARIGGYVKKEQLLEVWGMDSSRYEGIKRYLTVNPEKITQIKLNTATFKELLRHPYMPYELAKGDSDLSEKEKRNQRAGGSGGNEEG